MTANEIRDVVRSQPFRPFTLFMADGSTYNIPHPDGIAIGNIIAMVAEPRTDEGDKFTRLSIRHIVRLEEAPVLDNGG